MALRLFCSKQICTSLIHPPIIYTSQVKTVYKVTRCRFHYKNGETKKLGLFVVDKYIHYFKNYNVYLEKKFPKTMKMYKLFTDGVKTFYKDTLEYIKISKIVRSSGNGINSLTRREIELYYKMPNDMFKIFPILLFAALPLANYVIFPLLYMFPKQLMTTHFWTESQKIQFAYENAVDRIKYKRDLFRVLRTYRLFDDYTQKQWLEMLGEINSGIDVDPTEIIKFKEFFIGKPLNIDNLKRRHIRLLCKLHQVNAFLFKRKKLRRYGYILKAMDRAIIMEGGVHNMPKLALINACVIRGYNPINKTEEELIIWLQKWMKISDVVDMDSVSLLLHTPLLLNYQRINIKKETEKLKQYNLQQQEKKPS